jgi:deoxyribodipyrimidine photolyase
MPWELFATRLCCKNPAERSFNMYKRAQETDEKRKEIREKQEKKI